MNLKHFLKEKCPPRVFGYLNKIYQQRKLFHYYFPYVFYSGKALNPAQITLEITFHCNQKCLMCPQAIEIGRKNSRSLKKRRILSELNTREVFSLVDEANRMKIKEFVITGGEPFLRGDIIPIINYIKHKGLRCSIISNGSLITRGLAKEMVTANLDRITFSLDGLQETHDKIRNTRNAFSNLMKAVSYVREERKNIKTNL